MGNATSFIKGHGKRIINRYNAQYRALKFIDEGNLPKASHHSPYDKMPPLGPEVASEIMNKDLKLDGFLKNVYVTSNSEVGKIESNKPLPEYRVSDDDDDDAVKFNEPSEIEPGYCTLTQITKFLAAHASDSKTYNAATIAKEYKLDEKKTESILKYHAIYTFIDAAKSGGSPNYQFVSMPDYYDKEDVPDPQKTETKLIREGTQTGNEETVIKNKEEIRKSQLQN